MSLCGNHRDTSKELKDNAAFVIVYIRRLEAKLVFRVALAVLGLRI